MQEHDCDRIALVLTAKIKGHYSGLVQGRLKLAAAFRPVCIRPLRTQYPF